MDALKTVTARDRINIRFWIFLLWTAAVVLSLPAAKPHLNDTQFRSSILLAGAISIGLWLNLARTPCSKCPGRIGWRALWTWSSGGPKIRGRCPHCRTNTDSV
jgi:hypothetical protein